MGRNSSNCLPKIDHVPAMHIRYTSFRYQIQYMKHHAPIGKFVGIFPSEKPLVWWIKSTWKPKGHYDMHIRSNGFFTLSFITLEDRNRVLDGGP